MYISKMSYKKQIFKANILKKLLNDENSCVSLVATTRLLPLPPFFLNDMKSGILYLLNNMLKKYDRSLGGIVIGYQNIKVLMDENTGIIPIGTSETEVNIGVEFYIFQPKIGSFLEGVVNKKSNNHIGCLVHRYFNATILKPDEIDYNDWICQDFNVDDKIIFKVKDLDFTGLLPHIEGIIDDSESFKKVKMNLNRNYDVDSHAMKDVVEKYQNEVSLTKKNKEVNNDDEGCTFEDNVNKNRNTLEFDSSSDSRRKKKKKKKEKEKKDESDLLNNCDQLDKEKSFNEELTSSDLNKEFNVGEEYYVKKKKKKKDKKKEEDEEVRNIQESSTAAENLSKENDSKTCTKQILEKFVAVEDENTYDFVKPKKKKKEKKKRKSEQEEPYVDFNKTSQGLFSNEADDNILHSTQIDPTFPKKMRISFCSPISKDTTSEEKNHKEDLNPLTPLKSQFEKNDKEKKNKYKKREREENTESEDFSSPKKIKTTHSFSSENEEMSHNEPKKKKSLVQTMFEELFKKQLKSVKESSDNSNKNAKERKKKKEKPKNKEKEVSQEESLNLSKNKKNQIKDEGEIEQNSVLTNTLDELQKQEIKRVQEELSCPDRESCKESKETKPKVNKKEKENSKEKLSEDSFVLKKNNKTQLNGANDGEENFSVREMMNRLLTQEITRVKELYKNSDAESFKESKKSKEKTNKAEAREKKTNISLYDKLLENAKSAMDIEKGESLTLPLPKESGKEKKKDILNKSTNSSKKKCSKEKMEIIERKTKDYNQTPEKYKNGNMYDMASTPQKMNFEKSLFSDSEQSHSTPVKKKKEVNGIESDSFVEASLKKKAETLKSRSDKKKERKSNKLEEKSEIKNPGKKEESLYEKLLREARSLVHSKNESTPKKDKSV